MCDILVHVSDWVTIDPSDDVFTALGENHRLLADAEVRELVLIAQACDEYTVDETEAGAASEKIIDGGAEGTTRIGEFLALEVAGLLEISPSVAVMRIRDTLELRDRHPELWARVQLGGVRPWQAFKITRRCAGAGLSLEAARWVDRQICAAIRGLGWVRSMRALDGLIVQADTTLAAQRAQWQRERRMVVVGEHADGGSILYARVDIEAAQALEETISDLANVLAAHGSTEPSEQRRATALGILADPKAALDLLTGHGDGTPTNRAATLVVHIAADSIDAIEGGVARIRGLGPLDTATLCRFLGHDRLTVRPVVNLNTVPPIDAYEIPVRMRQQVCARNPVEVFPFSARPAETLDLDHTVPYEWGSPPGSRQTRPDNLGPLSRRVHRAKTARLWKLRQPEPGVFLWTSPHGFRYEVTPEGTTSLGRFPTPDAA